MTRSTPGERRLLPSDGRPPALDELDRRLIAELVADGRATYTALADRVGLSQPATRVRVRRLLDEGVVTVSARIDPRSLGTAVFAFALVTVDGPFAEAAEAVGRLREAVFVVGTAERWSLLVELRCRDQHHLLEVLDRMRGARGVSGLETLSVLEYFKQSWTGLTPELTGDSRPQRATPVPATRELDAYDRRLIELLTHDGRATFTALAPAVGLSEAGVRARVRQLIDEGVVVIQAVAAADALEISNVSAALVRTNGPVSAVAVRLSGLPGTTIVAATSGRFDLACEIWSSEKTPLLDTIESIRAIEHVASVEVANYLHIFKEQYELDGSAEGGSR